MLLTKTVMIDNDMHPDIRPEAAEAVPQYCDNDIIVSIVLEPTHWIFLRLFLPFSFTFQIIIIFKKKKKDNNK